MDAYLTKPITGRKLIEAVERLAGRAKPPQAAPPQAEPPQAAPPPDTPPPVSPEPPELAIEVFDREAARVSLGGRDNLLQEMTAFFFEDAPRRLAEIQAGLRDQSPSAIARAAHRLNGTLVYLGANPAWRRASRQRRRSDASRLGDPNPDRPDRKVGRSAAVVVRRPDLLTWREVSWGLGGSPCQQFWKALPRRRDLSSNSHPRPVELEVHTAAGPARIAYGFS
jgi:hypothetical protein